ncbi:MAG: MMPL family transporter [Candidatus Dormibacteria bacterium]
MSVMERAGGWIARRRFFILGAWLLSAAALTLLVTPLDTVVANTNLSFIPDGSPIYHAYDVMSQAFGGGASRGLAIVVYEDRSGLSDQDVAYIRDQVAWMSRQPWVTDVATYFDHPDAKSHYVSHDGTTMYVPVGLVPKTGVPASTDAVRQLREHIATGRPAAVGAQVTGDAAIIADYQDSVKHSVDTTRIVTILLVVLILLLVYRSPVTPWIPLTTIGIAYLTARGLVALLGQHGMRVSTFTDTFLIAIVFGAGTDYCLFLISRFKEQIAGGDSVPAGLGTTLHRVGEALMSSAGTVILGGLVMATASVALFNSTGPAIAVGVLVSLCAGLTLAPALMVISGRFLFWPHRAVRDQPGRFWTAVSNLIANRPAPVLALSLVALLLLAASAPSLVVSYDQVSPQPRQNESVQGLATLDRHFPPGEVLPTYVVIQSPDPMDNTAGLLALDAATVAAAQAPGSALARSFTRPDGQHLPATGATTQLAQLAAGLHAARTAAAGGGAQLAGGVGSLSSGAAAADAAARGLATGAAALDSGLAPAALGGVAAVGASAQLESGAAQLATSEDSAIAALGQLLAGLTQMRDALAGDPTPQGTASYQQLRDQVVPGLTLLVQGETQVRDGARQVAAGQGALTAALRQLAQGIATARTGAAELSGGSSKLAAGLDRLAGGAKQLQSAAPSGLSALTSGLDAATLYLDTYTAQAAAAGLDPYYLPPGHLADPALTTARSVYLSPDARVARILVVPSVNPYSNAGMTHSAVVHDAVQAALQHGPLRSAQVFVAGVEVQDVALSQLSGSDYTRMLIFVLLAVFVVLALMLRSLVAPVYLLGSVVLSYAAALGATVLVFHDLLGQVIDWTVPIFAFVMLVAVGADYNIFLMSRLREEVALDPANGIARAVRRTGRIITSAGLVFAGTFVAMTAAPVTALEQVGFAISLGLLLDTFLVRSFTVPAVAMLLGRWSWWPGPGFRASTLAGAPPGRSDRGREAA